jgi:hypothetical protein
MVLDCIGSVAGADARRRKTMEFQHLSNMNSRRQFLRNLAISVSAPVAIGSRALAQDTPPPPGKLEESDPVAMALGYREDTTKVDQKKYPQHKPEQRCDGCALYTGKAGDPSGPCTAVGNKTVTAGGWCLAWAKKP